MSDLTNNQSHLNSLIEDTSRFTPLYVIQMFLEILYHQQGTHIIIPEGLLECGPEIEENLIQDLEKISVIAGSGDSKEISKHITQFRPFDMIFRIQTRYDALFQTLFCSNTSIAICGTFESFMSRMKHPNIINHDVLKDLIPVPSNIIHGAYEWDTIFNGIFRYILYLKTKHLQLVNKDELYFRPMCFRHPDPMTNDFIFNY